MTSSCILIPSIVTTVNVRGACPSVCPPPPGGPRPHQPPPPAGLAPPGSADHHQYGRVLPRGTKGAQGCKACRATSGEGRLGRVGEPNRKSLSDFQKQKTTIILGYSNGFGFKDTSIESMLLGCQRWLKYILMQ